MRVHGWLVLSGATFIAAVVIGAGAPLAQQHSYTPQEIADGRKLYDANCGRCHGNDGAAVTGIELFKQIRRASSDEEIAKLIQNGIPGTSMPPHAFSAPQALSVVAFLRSMVGVTPGSAAAGGTTASRSSGDPARGKQVFTGKGGCAGCHRAEGAGGTSGPDLSQIGRTSLAGPIPGVDLASSLERSILDPNADLPPVYRVFQVTPKSGAQVRGTLLNQDTFSVQMLDTDKNLRSFMKADLKDSGFVPSPMPSYQGRLTPQEIADVVSYLLTLKG